VQRVEDYVLWMSLARLGNVMNSLDDWATYRLHSGQESLARVQRTGVRLVGQARRDLGKSLGMTPAQIHAKHFAWSLAQALPRNGLQKLWWREERLS
jgi:hypothetical protein